MTDEVLSALALSPLSDGPMDSRHAVLPCSEILTAESRECTTSSVLSKYVQLR